MFSACHDTAMFYEQAKSYHTMSRNSPLHSWKLTINREEDQKNLNRSCTCPAGEGCCCHIFSLLYQVAHFLALKCTKVPKTTNYCHCYRAVIPVSLPSPWLSSTPYAAAVFHFPNADVRHQTTWTPMIFRNLMKKLELSLTPNPFAGYGVMTTRRSFICSPRWPPQPSRSLPVVPQIALHNWLVAPSKWRLNRQYAW